MFCDENYEALTMAWIDYGVNIELSKDSDVFGVQKCSSFSTQCVQNAR